MLGMISECFMVLKSWIFLKFSRSSKRHCEAMKVSVRDIFLPLLFTFQSLKLITRSGTSPNLFWCPRIEFFSPRKKTELSSHMILVDKNLRLMFFCLGNVCDEVQNIHVNCIKRTLQISLHVLVGQSWLTWFDQYRYCYCILNKIALPHILVIVYGNSVFQSYRPFTRIQFVPFKVFHDTDRYQWPHIERTLAWVSRVSA